MGLLANLYWFGAVGFFFVLVIRGNVIVTYSNIHRYIKEPNSPETSSVIQEV